MRRGMPDETQDDVMRSVCDLVESIVELNCITDDVGGNRWRLYVFIG
jgi:hypothetical protein